MSDTLLLNKDFLPLSVLPLSTVNWQTAIKLMCLDKIYVLEHYPNWVVRSEKLVMRVPSVCVSKEYFSFKRAVKFSRQNLFLRDMYTCQYCGDAFPYDGLTIDHVIPRSSGGKTTFDNCVAACHECNHRKGSKLQRPLRMPFKPDYYSLLNAWKSRKIHVAERGWLKYLGLDESDGKVIINS